MTTKFKVIHLAITAALLNCGPPATEEEGADDGSESSCPKLQERGPEGCSFVTVNSISSQEFEFERDGWVLRGSLLVPETAGEYSPPGAVLIHGSGPLGRRGLMEGHVGVMYDSAIPVYESLAQQLAYSGFVVLTYDKRSCFKENSAECGLSISDYPADLNEILLDDFYQDARAAVVALSKYLQAEVVVIGHSQGALFVPLLSQQESAVCGGVLLAPAVLDLPTTISDQYGDYADYIESVDPSNPAIDDLRMLQDETLLALQEIQAGTYPSDSWMGAPIEFWESWIVAQSGLQESLSQTSVSVFAAFAGFDFNVGHQHEVQLKEWAADGAYPMMTIEHYDDHTHAFVPLLDTPSSYGDMFSPEVVEDIVNWTTGLNE